MYDYSKVNFILYRRSNDSSNIMGTKSSIIFDSPIPQLPWGIVSLVDLYAGFTLFGLWIAYKEPPLKTFFWVIGLILLGNFTTALYVDL